MSRWLEIWRVPGILTASTLLPRTIELLLLTTAPAPMAVALTRSSEPTSAFQPNAVLKLPVVFELPERLPTKTLNDPLEFCPPVPSPKKEFSLPKVFSSPEHEPKKEFLNPLKPAPGLVSLHASAPKKELLWPVVLVNPAELPKKALSMPSVLEKPALDPKKELPLAVLFPPADLPKKAL